MHRELFYTLGSSETESRPGELRIEVRNGTTVIENRPYSQVHLHLGDGTLLASLQSLSQTNTGSIVIDRSGNLMENVMDELSHGPVQFHSIQKNRYYDSLNKTMGDEAGRQLVEHAYTHAMNSAKKSISNLYLVQGDITKQPRHLPFADRVTLYYPGTEIDDHAQLIRYAAAVTKVGGTIEVVGEHRDIMGEYQQVGGSYVASFQRKGREDSKEPFVSAYAIALRNLEQYTLTMVKSDDRMGDVIYRNTRSPWETIQDTIGHLRGK